jgi:hypothetical protein
MIFLPDVFRTQDRAESILPFWRPVAPTAFEVNPRYLPQCISGAVTESRIYPRVRMEFTNLRSPGCAWKPVDEIVCAE